MPPDDRVYLTHMLDTARKLEEKSSDLHRAQFLADENLHLACVHLVQILGEAASRVSTGTRSRYSNIPWRQIIGMRHRVEHDYLAVDLEIVWAVITQDVPTLIPELERAATA